MKDIFYEERRINMKYKFEEVETIDEMYDQESIAKVIAEEVNRSFHNDQPVRNEKSVYYVVYKIHNDPEWYEKLQIEWENKSN
jgi:hypothetical protein